MAKVLYGDCVADRDSAQVRISELAGAGCELRTVAASSPIEGDVALWIGAVGPIEATAVRRDREHVSLRFKEPLSSEILYHFGCG
ncbi:hypothetical protein [Novosphingobium colocasiae]|uniref:hypothetical protein n=1 Tax=Novosphingobium colocasiae TaxID=1256513 RepID=UPI00167693FF|nr:hypothetical protein [Novosphingobium colocasiae]